MLSPLGKATESEQVSTTSSLESVKRWWVKGEDISTTFLRWGLSFFSNSESDRSQQARKNTSAMRLLFDMTQLRRREFDMILNMYTPTDKMFHSGRCSRCSQTRSMFLQQFHTMILNIWLEKTRKLTNSRPEIGKQAMTFHVFNVLILESHVTQRLIHCPVMR